MITGYAFAVVLCALMLGLVFFLLRTRRLREKYAGIWIIVSFGIALLAIFPKLAFWLAELAQVKTTTNLLFAIAAAVLLAVCIQLSTEVSALEEETRTIAEELALLRLEVRSMAATDTAVPTIVTQAVPAAAAWAPGPELRAPSQPLQASDGTSWTGPYGAGLPDQPIEAPVPTLDIQQRGA
jgi:hypothetical protein